MSFRCRTPGASTFIEFEGSVLSASLNGDALPGLEGGRLRLDRLAAENELTIKGVGNYSRDGTGINWFRDPVDGRTYLHSQFAEHWTYRGFPCFDQPDLKATFAFTVKAPASWVVVSNGAGTKDAEGVWTFSKTSKLSTYITAVVAGEFHSVHQDHRGIPLGLYCRQSLAEYLDRTRSSRSPARASTFSKDASTTRIPLASTTSSTCPSSPRARWRTPPASPTTSG